MIEQYEEFLCGSKDNPTAAWMVCTKQECRSHAFICIKKNCDCKVSHRGHCMIFIQDMMMQVSQTTELLGTLVRMGNDIDSAIDTAIQELNNLKTSHRNQIEEYKSKIPRNFLYEALLSADRLDLEVPTGGSFWQVLQDIDKISEISSPYLIRNQEVCKLLASFQNESSILANKLQRIWKAPSFKFSREHKHPDIKLSADNTTVTTTGQSDLPILVIEPALQLGTTNRIIFQADQLRRMEVGVCYKEQSSTTYDCFENCLPFPPGKAIRQATVVSVELEPSTGRLTFSRSDGVSSFTSTDIRSTTKQPVNFYIHLHSKGANSVSIV